MRMCDRGVQMLITTVGAFAAFSLMTIAVGTDYWLYSRGVCRTKSTSDNDTSRKNEEVMTHSGLWRTCCLEGTDRPADPHLRHPPPARYPGPAGGPAQKFGGGQGHPGTLHPPQSRIPGEPQAPAAGERSRPSLPAPPPPSPGRETPLAVAPPRARVKLVGWLPHAGRGLRVEPGPGDGRGVPGSPRARGPALPLGSRAVHPPGSAVRLLALGETGERQDERPQVPLPAPGAALM